MRLESTVFGGGAIRNGQTLRGIGGENMSILRLLDAQYTVTAVLINMSFGELGEG